MTKSDVTVLLDLVLREPRAWYRNQTKVDDVALDDVLHQNRPAWTHVSLVNATWTGTGCVNGVTTMECEFRKVCL